MATEESVEAGVAGLKVTEETPTKADAVVERVEEVVEGAMVEEQVAADAVVEDVAVDAAAVKGDVAAPVADVPVEATAVDAAVTGATSEPPPAPVMPTEEAPAVAPEAAAVDTAVDTTVDTAADTTVDTTADTTVEEETADAAEAAEGTAEVQNGPIAEVEETGKALEPTATQIEALTPAAAAERLSKDELDRVKFLVAMRDQRGLAEEEALELKEFAFKIIKGKDSDEFLDLLSLPSAKKRLSFQNKPERASTSITSSANLAHMGLSPEEQLELSRYLKIKKKRELLIPEEIRYEAIRQRMVDYSWRTYLPKITQILQSDEFALKPVRSSRAPSVREIPEPEIKLEPYGNNYASDIFTLLHNSVKREITDLYTILASIKKRTVLVDREDLAMFFAWWDDFYLFTVKNFEVEDKFVLPWVTRRVNVSKTIMQQTSRNLRRSKITYKLREISNLRTTGALDRMHPGEMISIIYNRWEKLYPELQSYFTDTERVLVPMVGRAYNANEKKDLQKEIWDYVKDTDNADLVIGLWFRWMTAKQRKDWKREVLGLFPGQQIKTLEANFEKREHVHIPAKVKEKEKRVMSQSSS